jgi:hypothetical protein
MKHTTFQSSYKPEFDVVEQREGRLRLYPHTEQLPTLLRALNLEFYGGLPARLARLDARGTGFDKIVLRHAALMYCACINAARKDSLRLVALPDHDLVTRITIAQRITEEADHVLKRFDQRVPTHIGEDLTFFLLAFYDCPVISMPIRPGRALIILRDKDILGFPYEARIRNWMPLPWMMRLYESWKAKELPQMVARLEKPASWYQLASMSKDSIVKQGHGQASRLSFIDHIPGPSVLECRPDQVEPQHDEMAELKRIQPEIDWDEEVKRRNL